LSAWRPPAAVNGRLGHPGGNCSTRPVRAQGLRSPLSHRSGRSCTRPRRQGRPLLPVIQIGRNRVHLWPKGSAGLTVRARPRSFELLLGLSESDLKTEYHRQPQRRGARKWEKLRDILSHEFIYGGKRSAPSSPCVGLGRKPVVAGAVPVRPSQGPVIEGRARKNPVAADRRGRHRELPAQQ